MMNKKMMTLLIAGGIACGGFVAMAEEAKAPVAPAAPATPAAPVVEAAKPEDVFAGVPAVIAEVKGEKITKDMLIADILAKVPGGVLPPNVTAAEFNQALPGIAKTMVIQKIMNAEMAKAGVKPSEEMVKQILTDELKKMDKTMLERITQDIQAQGQTLEQYVGEMAKNPILQEQVANQKFLEDKVMGNIKADTNITADEIKKFYDENANEFKEDADKPEQIRASHILITPTEKTDAADKAAQEKAGALLKQLQDKPELFAELAKENSACPSSARGGSLGAFDKGQMVPEFDAAVAALKPGELSALVKTDFGYHIIRRDALQTEGRVTPLEDVKGDIESFLKARKGMEADQARQKATAEYFENLEKEYEVKYLVPMPADLGK